jgi:hypothetical protein
VQLQPLVWHSLVGTEFRNRVSRPRPNRRSGGVRDSRPRILWRSARHARDSKAGGAAFAKWQFQETNLDSLRVISTNCGRLCSRVEARKPMTPLHPATAAFLPKTLGVTASHSSSCPLPPQYRPRIAHSFSSPRPQNTSNSYDFSQISNPDGSETSLHRNIAGC